MDGACHYLQELCLTGFQNNYKYQARGKKHLFILLRKLYKDIGSIKNYQKQTKESWGEKEY
jgi:hypothetical protein